MEPADDRILEYIMSHGPSSVKSMDESTEIDYHYQTLAKRARILAEHEMLDKIGQGSYQLGDKGQRYLGGTVDLRDEEVPE